jgi:hypothetical protein
MIDYLLDFYDDDLTTWSLEKIIYYYQWYNSYTGRKDLCDIINNYVYWDEVKGAIKDY